MNCLGEKGEGRRVSEKGMHCMRSEMKMALKFLSVLCIVTEHVTPAKIGMMTAL